MGVRKLAHHAVRSIALQTSYAQGVASTSLVGVLLNNGRWVRTDGRKRCFASVPSRTDVRSRFPSGVDRCRNQAWRPLTAPLCPTHRPKLCKNCWEMLLPAPRRKKGLPHVRGIRLARFAFHFDQKTRVKFGLAFVVPASSSTFPWENSPLF